MDAHFQEVSQETPEGLAQAEIATPSAGAATQTEEEKKAAPPDEIDEGAIKGETVPEAPELKKDAEGIPDIPPSPGVEGSVASPEGEGTDTP